MKKLIILILGLWALSAQAQTVGQFRYDTTKFLKVGGRNNVMIENLIQVTDSTYKALVIGADGVIKKITYWPGTGTGGGGSGISQLGSPAYGLIRVNDSTYIADTSLLASKPYVDAKDALKIYNQFDSLQMAKYWIDSARIGESRSILGSLVNDNFNRFGFGVNYDSVVSATTITYNGSFLQSNGGSTSFTNYFRYKSFTGLNRWSESVTFKAVDKSGATYGLALGVKSSNANYNPDIIVHFRQTDGRIDLYYDDNVSAPITQSATSLSFTAGDTLQGTVKRVDDTLRCVYNNLTTRDSVVHIYIYPTSVAGTIQPHNIGQFTVYFLGGNQHIYNHSIYSSTSKNNILFIGNSIEWGYASAEIKNRFSSKIFDGARYNYETSGGPGDKSADVLKMLPQVSLLSPKYTIVNIGVNDGRNGVGAVTYKANMDSIVRYLLAIPTIPILVNLCPNNGFSFSPYVDSLKSVATARGVKYINIYDSLRSGDNYLAAYNGDNIHPNTAGHALIARIIKREAPEILPTNKLYVGRLKYDSAAKYLLAYNENDGSTIITKRPIELTASGSTGQIQYNKSGSFAASSNLFWDATNARLGVGNAAPTARLTVGTTANVFGTSIGSFGGDINGETSIFVSNATNGTSALAALRVFGTADRSSYLGEIAPLNTSVPTNFAGAFVIEPNSPVALGHDLVLSIPAVAFNSRLRVYAGDRSTEKFSVTATGTGVGDSIPTSKFVVNGSFATKYTATSINITAADHSIIDLTATGLTATLPTAIGITGREYTIKLTGAGTGTIATTSSQTIDGSTTYSLSAQYKYVTVKSTGANWIIIGNN